MKTLKYISNYIDKLLTQWSLNYIDRVSKTLYPKPHLDKTSKIETVEKEEDENKDEEEPILFI